MTEDADEKARIVTCVKRGIAVLGEEVSGSTLDFIQGQSGMTLEKLVDYPNVLVLTLRQVFGLQSFLVFKSIRLELLLSTVGHPPRSVRVEEFLMALIKAKESVIASRD